MVSSARFRPLVVVSHLVVIPGVVDLLVDRYKFRLRWSPISKILADFRPAALIDGLGMTPRMHAT